MESVVWYKYKTKNETESRIFQWGFIKIVGITYLHKI